MSEIQFSGLPGDNVQNPAPAIDPKTGIPFADHKPDDSPTHLAEFKMEGIDYKNVTLIQSLNDWLKYEIPKK